MGKIIDMVYKLRNGRPLYMDYVRDRHSIIATEDNGEKTAYCFSIPIYNDNINQVLEPVFCKEEGIVHMGGSNAVVNIKQNISLRNRFGEAKIIYDSYYDYVSDKEVRFKEGKICPAFNGIQCIAECIGNQQHRFVLKTNYSEAGIWANNKCISIMREHFTPLVSVSCIGALDTEERVIAPIKLEYKQIDEFSYEIAMSALSPYARYIKYEINMYEPKLFQDTTVESKDSQSNNVFGGTAFIGNTELYGEQWLYIRPDMGLLAELKYDSIYQVKLHLPIHRDEKVDIRAYMVSRRFCSFGSNWDNKVPVNSKGICPVNNNGFLSFDITEMFSRYSFGYIIKPEQRDGGFVCVSTGDNYVEPAVLEIRMRE